MPIELYKRGVRHFKHACISDSSLFLQVLYIGQVVLANCFV